MSSPSLQTNPTEKFWETLRRWKLFIPGEKVLLAVSGGVDSMVLLHLFLNLPKPKRVQVVVAHYDHGLRGRESAAEARFVARMAKKWGVKFFSEKAPAWKNKTNLHERARQLRYDFFKKIAKRQKIRKIITAHQANDQAENFLMRWIQGASLKGLSGISLMREEEDFLLIRPLLFVTRKEILLYSKTHQIPFCEDPSNQNDHYLRSRLRKWLRSLEAENPKLAEKTSIQSLFLKADSEFLEKHVEKLLSKANRKPHHTIKISLSYLRSQPASCRYRAYVGWVHWLAPHKTLSSDKILKIDELVFKENVEGPNGLQYSLGDGVYFLKKKCIKFSIDSSKSAC